VLVHSEKGVSGILDIICNCQDLTLTVLKET